ncbi:RNA polymerase sigma-70 factor [uncultured Parabacteroides sp.]|uniref:RNA polymerase sigma-70 factor n=1 Tax=uncultured Parabacteroides sp. TaxID=512312 RepID=UPI0025927B62|nr:RNA polymerase sigma-70 factor [uncultured Parabacteroides sp.]
MRASGEKGDLIPQDEVELFKKIYVAYTPDLVATAARYVSMSVAEDLVQELFLKVWNQKLFLCVKASELRYFLFASLRNSCLDVLRHEEVKLGYIDYYKKNLEMEILSCSDQPFYYAEENNNLDALFREVNKLPPKCREIFLESYIDGKKSAEIAREKCISQRTVEAQLYKALKMLRSALALLSLFFSLLSK